MTLYLIVSICSVITGALVLISSTKLLSKQVVALNNICTEELIKMSEYIKEDTKAHRERAEMDLSRLIQSETSKLEELQKSAAANAANQLKLLDEDLVQKQGQLIEEYARIEKYFRESMQEDVTLHVLTAAYALVASGKVPQTEQGSELLQAVIAHRKEGSPLIDAPIDFSKITKAIN